MDSSEYIEQEQKKLREESQDFLEKRRQAYLSVFDNPNGEVVLEDLAKFCRASETTFHENARVDAVLSGRREVFLRICEHIHLTQPQLFRMKGL